MAAGRVCFIPGASRGFGKAFAGAALGRGDRVAATVDRCEKRLEGFRAVEALARGADD